MTGGRVVVVVGDLVGYLRAADPAAFVAFDAEEPIVWLGAWGE